jgi:PAS domain S-box-containing protein
MKASTDKTLAACFGLAVVVLMAVGWLQYRTTQHLVEAGRLVIHTDEVMAQIESLLTEVKGAESGVRGYVATGDEMLFPVSTPVSAAESAKRLKDLRLLTSDNASQQKRLDTLEPLVSRRFEHLGQVLQFLQEGGLPAARDYMKQGEGVRLTNRISQIATEMENEERGLLAQRSAAAAARTRTANAFILTGTLIAIGLLLLPVWFISRETAERKRSEEALQRASAYNRSLIEASLDPLVTIAPDGKITDVNNATKDVTGFSREELIGTDFSDYFTEPERARAGYQQVFREGKVQDYGLEIRHRDGHIRPVLYNASVYRDQSGTVVGVFAAARDITAQKQASQYARSLIEASLDPLVTISSEGKITDVNEATIKVSGVRREELVGTDFSDYFTEPQKAREGYQQVFAKGSVTDYPLTIRHRDGILINVLYNASVYKDIHGNVLGVFAAARDVTERKRAEAEILKLNAELEERVADRTAELTASNKEMESFTYAVAHDLRAPLRHIQGFSSLLMADYASQLDESARRYLQRIQQGVERMAHLLEDLLNLSRLGRQELRLQVCGLNSVVEETLQELKPELKDRQVEWQIGHLPYTECDPSLMKQVFTNLLSNAAKFTRPREKALIQVDQTTVGGQPAIYVRDNGVGFSMKYADKLFGIFQRLHRQEDFEGTGVGLATVHRIIDKHGGRLWAEAELDKGATFYFTLGASNGLKKDETSSGGEK